MINGLAHHGSLFAPADLSSESGWRLETLAREARTAEKLSRNLCEQTIENDNSSMSASAWTKLDSAAIRAKMSRSKFTQTN